MLLNTILPHKYKVMERSRKTCQRLTGCSKMRVMKTKHIPYLLTNKLFLSIAVCAGLVLSACGEASATPLVVIAGEESFVGETETIQVPATPGDEETKEAVETETVEVFEPKTIHIMAVGDNLLHEGIISTGRQPDGSLNYDFEFADIKPFIDAADIAVINQETPLAGNSYGFKGYPCFNSPTEVGDAIANAGFNVVTAATNHAYDQKAKGLYSYADYFVENHPEIVLCGIRGNLPNLHGQPKTSEGPAETVSLAETKETAAEESETKASDAAASPRNERIQYLEIQGYTFALLNYTYGTNLATYPSDAEGHLDMLCDYSRKNRMLNFTALNDYVLPDIYEAKQTSDFVIVFPHWGNEYQTTASPYQEAWAKMFADAGADLIIGCHPHVVQPVTKVVSDLGNEVLCYYSLGNFASLQRQRRAMFEAMAWVTLTDDEEGKLHIVEEESGALPMVMQYTTGARFQAVVPLDEYTESLAASHGIITRGEGKLSITDMNNWADTLLTTYRMKKEEILKEPTYFSGPVTE